MKRFLPLLSLFSLLSAPTILSAQVLSNGTGGGDWSTGTTWQGGNPPSNANFNILTGDVVTATGVTLSGTQNPDINGTLNIESGTDMTVGRIEGTPGTGIINVNDGGILTADRYTTSQTININNGGYFTLTSLGNNDTITNVNAGGTWETFSNAAFNGSNQTLNGGTVIQNNASVRGVDTWNSGTMITNTGSVTSNTEASFFVSQMTTSAHILQVSNQSTAQTLTFANGFLAGFTGGVFRFNIYSATDNDSDQIVATTPDLSLDSAVTLELNGVSLSGTAGDYLGSSYQLFNDATFADLTPTIGSTTWNIGGHEYVVTFTDNLALDGSLTISNLALVPEPSTTILFGGALFLLGTFRRRR